MKKIIKSRVFAFILGAIIFGSIGVVSAYTIFADNIGYTPKDSTWKKSNGEDITNVKDAIDELYNKANTNNLNTVCIRLSGTKETVGAKYVCNPGDGIYRTFYVLKVNDDTVDLIMDRNITDTLGENVTISFEDANSFFEEGHPGYATKTSWTGVISVNLPNAQDIATAGGISGFDVTTATQNDWSYFGVNSKSDTSERRNYNWLYGYTRACYSYDCIESMPDNQNYPYGYWTKNVVIGNSNYAWLVNRNGNLSRDFVTDTTIDGVRPVITVSKSNLAG